MVKEPTIQNVLDVLEILQAHATHVDTQFAEVRSEISAIRSGMTQMKGEISELKGDVGEIRQSIITKDYLDDRLAELRGEPASEAYRQIRKHEARYHGA